MGLHPTPNPIDPKPETARAWTNVRPDDDGNGRTSGSASGTLGWPGSLAAEISDLRPARKVQRYHIMLLRAVC